MPRGGTRVYGGLAALPIQARYCLSLLEKRLLHPRRYPLLILDPSRGGFLKTLLLTRRLGLTKVIRVGDRYQFSLLEPRWPSAAYDEMLAKGGLNVAAAGTERKAQIGLAILGITRACAYRCAHCYERPNLGSEDVVPVSRWLEVIRELQEISVGVVVLSGGDPLTRFERTLEVLEGADKRRTDFHLHTSGNGATPERVSALAKAGLAAVGIGLDDHDRARHDALRGHPGAYDDALRAIGLFASAGVLVYVNACVTPELVRSGGLRRLYETLHGLGVGALQLLEPRPCGGYGGRDPASLLGPEERWAVREFFEETHHSPRYRRHPAVYYPARMEEVLGCLGGGLSHLYIDSLGNVEPCVFLPVSFGNVLQEPVRAILGRMRDAMPRPLRGPCPALQLAESVGFRDAPLPAPSIRAAWRGLSG